MKMQASVSETIRSYAIMTVGLFIYSLGWASFILPAQVVSGGVAGMASAIFYATGFPVEYSYVGINAVLLVLAIKILGASFGVKTIYSIAMITLFVRILRGVITEPIVSESFMATVIGGAIGGLGIGLVFLQGGSTGGTDIIAMIINKYRDIMPGRAIMVCDALVVASSYFIFNSVEKMVYGFVTMFTLTYCIDIVLVGRKQSVQMMIFSKHYAEIADAITSQLDRGVTILEGQGWYSKQEVKVILSIVKKTQVQAVHHIVKQIDPQAFISQEAVMSVYGEGFDVIK
ncbi:MAG: YitT family protein [Salinivirgaceae bacterium]|nr:YitT family protein [Salinivirgaceae bacterium]